MADQAVAVDLPDEYTEEWGDAFTLKAHRVASKHAGEIMLDVSQELSQKKHPLIKRLLHDTGLMAGTVELAARGAFKLIKEGKATEEEIIEQITRGETGYPPAETRSDALALAELLTRRDRLEDLWHRFEQAEGEEAKRLWDSCKDAQINFDIGVLRLIQSGKVDPAQAVAAALDEMQSFDLGRTEHPDLVPPADADSADDVRVLAEISQDIATHTQYLSEGSRWRVPLKHFADRLLARPEVAR